MTWATASATAESWADASAASETWSYSSVTNEEWSTRIEYDWLLGSGFWDDTGVWSDIDLWNDSAISGPWLSLVVTNEEWLLPAKTVESLSFFQDDGATQVYMTLTITNHGYSVADSIRLIGFSGDPLNEAYPFITWLNFGKMANQTVTLDAVTTNTISFYFTETPAVTYDGDFEIFLDAMNEIGDPSVRGIIE